MEMIGLRARTTVDLHGLRLAGGAMLATAALLPVLPGPNGVPCPLRTITGIPCPLCGMTTSVTAIVHLDLVEAVTANPAGVVAAVVAVALLVMRSRRQVDVPVWLLPLGLVLMWAWQLGRFGIL